MMKVAISILLSLGLALCEVPPYPPRGFRPSPPFNLPVRQPQTSYGVPAAAPSKVSQSSPQTQYGVPNQQAPSSLPNPTPNFSSKQTIPSTSYGVPVPNNPYRTIISESLADNSVSNQQGLRPLPSLSPNFNPKQTAPSNNYGAPATGSPYRTIINEPQVFQNTGVPNSQNRPSAQYDVPDARNVETLEQIRQLNFLLQLSQSSKANQQNQANINLAQSQNSNRNVEVPSQQYLPVKEATNFRGNLQSQNSQQNNGRPSQGYLPAQQPANFGNRFESTNQEPFDVRIPSSNLQTLSQQYLPVKDASNFEKGVEFPQPNIPQRQNLQPNVNYQQPLNNPQLFNTGDSSQNNQQQLPNINPNIALPPQNPRPSLNSYEAPLQSNVDVQQLNVRRLQNSNNRQTSIRQDAVQPVQPVQQNREFGDSNIQGANREQVDEKYLPPTTTARTVQRPVSLPKGSSDEDEQSTESKEEAGGPNIAVATAVSGVPGGQSFYLLQPDGRLQRVIYQKTQAESDRENEYTANYLFQNIQADPSLVYSPLVTLGKR